MKKSMRMFFVWILVIVFTIAITNSVMPNNDLSVYAEEESPTPETIIVQNGDANYSERAGTWSTVNAIGYDGSTVRRSNTSSARVMWWLPRGESEGYYTVSIYKVVTPDGDPNAVVGVMHATGAESFSQDWTTGTSGWVTLGTFYMRPGNATTIVSLVRGKYNNGTGYATADAVKFEAAPTYTPAPAPPASNPAPDPSYLPEGYELAFSDDFNGTSLDTSVWDHQDGTYYVNGYTGAYRPENVTVSDGTCKIAMKKESYGGAQYTTGGIISKPSFGFGYYEARLKFSGTGSGFHQSFWLYTNIGNRETTQDSYDEVDIIETDSSNVNNYYITYHDWHWLSSAHDAYSVASVNTSSLSDNYHTFGALYTNTEVKFYLDGSLVGSRNISSIQKNRNSIRLNNVVYQPVVDTYLPGEYDIDWVRYYEAPDEGQTPPTPTPVPPPVDPFFSDDFEDGDSSGWTPVDGTWSVVTDGSKVLEQTSSGVTALSYAGDISWTDYTAVARVKANELPTYSASGILARYTNADNNYWLRLHQSGMIQLYKKVNGITTLLQEAAVPVSSGTWYTLKLVLNGSNLTGYINDVRKISVTDNSLSYGCIGIKSFQQSFSVDDVVVYEAPVFSDDFEDGDSSGWTPVDGTWSVVTDGSKVLEQTSSGVTALSYAGDISWTDYTAVARVKANELPTYSASGILARYTNADNNYWLRLHQSGKIQLYKKVNGVTTLLQEAAVPVNRGTWYTLKLVLDGNSLIGYIDGVQKISVTDSSLSHGCIGVKSYQQSFSIDDVAVY